MLGTVLVAVKINDKSDSTFLKKISNEIFSIWQNKKSKIQFSS